MAPAPALRRLATAVATVLVGTLCAACAGGDGEERSGPPEAAGSGRVETAGDAAAAVEDVVDDWLGSTTGVVALVRVGEDTRVVTSELADVASEEPMERGTRVQVASVTKPMVAAVVMQLVEEETVGLDDTVERWLPGLLPEGDRITVEQLLAHRSGLPEYGDSLDLDPERRYSPSGLVRLVADDDLEVAPGADFRYSNTNYVVLGMLIEQATGRSADVELRERIFAPAGMTATSFGVADIPGSPAARGYEGTRDVTLTDLGIAHTAGGVVSTVDDLSRFWRALLSGSLVSPASVEQMTRDRTDGDDAHYGLGVERIFLSCGSALGHFGGLPGFTTAAFTLTEGDRALMATINDSDANQQTGELLEAALCG